MSNNEYMFNENGRLLTLTDAEHITRYLVNWYLHEVVDSDFLFTVNMGLELHEAVMKVENWTLTQDNVHATLCSCIAFKQQWIDLNYILADLFRKNGIPVRQWQYMKCEDD